MSEGSPSRPSYREREHQRSTSDVQGVAATPASCTCSTCAAELAVQATYQEDIKQEMARYGTLVHHILGMVTH